MEEITCGGGEESGQKRQKISSRFEGSGASPVMTQERVIGSFRSSIAHKENIKDGAESNDAGLGRGS